MQQGPLVLLVCLALLLDSFFARAVTPTAAQSYDLVLTGGRVMDPESGLNGTRNIGIRAGRIAAISTTLQPNHAMNPPPFQLALYSCSIVAANSTARVFRLQP